jgi:low temperature requirement protein LtrA
MTLARWTPPRLISERHPDQRTVEWLELFYDLVYVAALIQLGQILVDDLSWRGVGRFVVLFTLLWWVWTSMTFLKNRVEVDDLAHRFLIFAQMFGIGAAAVAVGGAFGARSVQFAFAFFFVMLTLVLMYVRVWLRIPGARSLLGPLSVLTAIAAAIWLASVFVPVPLRYWLWGVAFLVSVSWTLSPRYRALLARDFSPDEDHLMERYALLTIIVLGESFIKVVGAVADMGASTSTYVHGLFAFLTSVGLWWTYFDDVADSPIKARSGRLPGVAAWTTLHLPLTMGLTAVGVGLKEIVLSDLGEAIDSAGAWVLVGALVLVFLSVAALDAITRSRHFGVRERDRVMWRLVAVVLLLILGVAAPAMTTTAFGVVVAAIVMGQIAIEALVAKQADRAMRVDVDRVIASALVGARCEHLERLSNTRPSTAGCLECVDNGMVWVHLRFCTVCGQVGCCDDSQGRHAAAHFAEAGHGTMRSMEPGEDWAWCYIDVVGLRSVASDVEAS